MICPYCKKQILENPDFCPNCGQPIQHSNSGNSSQNYWNEYMETIDKDAKEKASIEAKFVAEKRQKQKTLLAVFISIATICILTVYFLIIMPARDYTKAIKLFESEQYDKAIAVFSGLKDYKDSSDMIVLCRYSKAKVDFENQNYSKALPVFNSLIDYKESKTYAGQCELYLLAKASNDETITMGNYNGIPIQWNILSKNESEALLISQQYIDTKIANTSNDGKYGHYACWSGSTLRQWLNNDFITDSFSSDITICLMTNSNHTYEYDIPNYKGWGAEAITVTTEDKVYIPSIEDVEIYGLVPTSLLGKNSEELITGWLRDRGHGVAFQKTLEPDGTYGSEWHFRSYYGIRPIIRINFEQYK